MGRAKSPIRTFQKSNDLAALRSSGLSHASLKQAVIVESERKDKENMPPLPAQVHQPEQEVEKAPTPPAAEPEVQVPVVAEKE